MITETDTKKLYARVLEIHISCGTVCYYINDNKRQNAVKPVTSEGIMLLVFN